MNEKVSQFRKLLRDKTVITTKWDQLLCMQYGVITYFAR